MIDKTTSPVETKTTPLFAIDTLKWTADRPTEPRQAWWFCEAGRPTEVCLLHIIDHHGELIASGLSVNSGNVSYFAPVAYLTGLWLGPMPVPAAPSPDLMEEMLP